jgi:hypothetical protein
MIDRVQHDLPPANTFDPVIEAYKKDVDRTLNRDLTVGSFAVSDSDLMGEYWATCVRRRSPMRALKTLVLIPPSATLFIRR